MLLLEGYVTLTATNGETIELPTNASGVDTGFARIDNPYWDGDEHWRFKDGDTVIGCDESHPNAMPLADAYQAFRAECDREKAELQAECLEWEREQAEKQAVSEWNKGDGELYEIQDRLGA